MSAETDVGGVTGPRTMLRQAPTKQRAQVIISVEEDEQRELDTWWANIAGSGIVPR